MKLSIIIPVYNVEEYIGKCILSLEEQDLPPDDYEIIVINDGSPDNSREIILKLAKRFNNIVFIEQENKGVSIARNAGIQRATGEYLLFIDPDDYVESNSFSEVLGQAIKQNAQVVFLEFRMLNPDNSLKKEIRYSEFAGNVYPGTKAYFISRGDGKTDPDRSWAILYQRSFLNDHHLQFVADIPYLEDGEFIARVLCLAQRCIFVEGPFYLRTTRYGSATNSGLFYSEKSFRGFIKAAENLVKFKQDKDLTSEQERFLNQPICKFTLLAVNSSFGKNSKIKLRRVKSELKSRGLLKCDLDGCNKIYTRDGFFFNLSPGVYSIYKPLWSVIDHYFFKLFKVRL